MTNQERPQLDGTNKNKPEFEEPLPLLENWKLTNPARPPAPLQHPCRSYKKVARRHSLSLYFLLTMGRLPLLLTPVIFNERMQQKILSQIQQLIDDGQTSPEIGYAIIHKIGQKLRRTVAATHVYSLMRRAYGVGVTMNFYENYRITGPGFEHGQPPENYTIYKSSDALPEIQLKIKNDEEHTIPVRSLVDLTLL